MGYRGNCREAVTKEFAEQVDLLHEESNFSLTQSWQNVSDDDFDVV